MDKTKKMIKESIALAIDAIKDDIQASADEDQNLKRAQAIKILTEAYKDVSR